MNPYERRARIEQLQDEIAEGEADIAARRVRRMAGEPDALEQWAARMPPKPPQPNPAQLLVDGLRADVERNRRESQASIQALRASLHSERKGLDRFATECGEVVGKQGAEIAKLRAEISELRSELATLRQKPETVVDMGKAFALRKATA